MSLKLLWHPLAVNEEFLWKKRVQPIAPVLAYFVGATCSGACIHAHSFCTSRSCSRPPKTDSILTCARPHSRKRVVLWHRRSLIAPLKVSEARRLTETLSSTVSTFQNLMFYFSPTRDSFMKNGELFQTYPRGHTFFCCCSDSRARARPTCYK